MGWLKDLLTSPLQMHQKLHRIRMAFPPAENPETFHVEDVRRKKDKMLLGLDGATAGTFRISPPNPHDVVYSTPDHLVRDICVLPPGTYDWSYSEESGLQWTKVDHQSLSETLK